MTHYKYSLLNKSGEGHIDTGIKIIIGIVVGTLILGGLYALFDNLVMPKLNAKVQDMMHYEKEPLHTGMVQLYPPCNTPMTVLLG